MMPRVFVDVQIDVGQNVVISGNDGHHYARVLRVQVGERLAIASAGVGYLGEITAIDSKEGTVQVRVIEALPSHESPASIYLIQGLAKGDKIDAILQHNTELGVAGFLLYESKRSIAKVDARKLEPKLARWQKIVHEAASQSQRDVIPHVAYASDVQQVERWLTNLDGPTVCFLDEDEHTTSLHAIIDPLLSPGNKPCVVLVVGPEGGWDDSERSAWKTRFQANSVTLGPRTLRTETAGMVAASAVLHHFYQLGG